jgi:hypothetical protein
MVKTKTKEFLKVGIYFTIINGKKIYDEDSMRDEFEEQLQDLQA